MQCALIIGASRGIGREFVRQLLAAGWRVYATARDEPALADLHAAGAVPLKVDVTRPESMAALGWQMDGVELDLAVYVAGVAGPLTGADASPTKAEFDRVMHTNVLGAMQIIPLIGPMVEAASGKFLFISSELGSIGEAGSSYAWVYRASKAALNMAVRAASFDYPKAVFAVFSPGWVRTDMGGAHAPLSVEESVRSMLTAIERKQLSDSGGFFNQCGDALYW
jgi:NAD(P)-dependent dehydrogenase (short-subunit alcohol dehydrogenase family)